jgi:hypothetical protein
VRGRGLRLSALAAILIAGAALSSGCSLFVGDRGHYLGGEEQSREIRRIAILPFAYRSDDDGRPCDLCPRHVDMKPTSKEDADLVTGFFYEQATRYPRLTILPYERVEQLQGATMRETLAQIDAVEKIDAVLVGAVIEFRDRGGEDPLSPTHPAGVAVYAALLEIPSGAPVWSSLFDQDQAPETFTYSTMRRVVQGELKHWNSPLEMGHVAATRMVKSLVARVE